MRRRETSNTYSTYEKDISIRSHKIGVRSDDKETKTMSVKNVLKSIAGYSVSIVENAVSFTINKTQKATLRRQCVTLNERMETFTKKANMEFRPMKENAFIKDELTDALNQWKKGKDIYTNLKFGRARS